MRRTSDEVDFFGTGPQTRPSHPLPDRTPADGYSRTAVFHGAPE